MSYVENSVYIFLLLSGVIFSVQIGKSNILRLIAKTLLVINGVVLTVYAGANYFTDEGVNDAVIYHLNYGLSGAGFLEYWKLILALVIFVISFPLFVWLLTKQWLAWWGMIGEDAAKIFLVGPLLILCAIVFSPLGFNFYEIYHSNIATTPEIQPYTVSYPSVQAKQKKIGLENLIYTLEPKNNNSSDEESYKLIAKKKFSQLDEVISPREFDRANMYIDSSYRKPIISKAKEQTKNLVYIYAESLERTYFDESLFPNLMSEVKKITQMNTVDFTDIRETAGTGWTIAGMVSSQCGIPLHTTSPGNTMGYMDKFLPLATCLGDLLSAEDYHLAYYGGAKLSFAGKGKFYATHQFDEIKGLDELGDITTPKSTWGLYDDYLFDRVYDRYVELASENKNFGLFALTLDTHHPKGHVTPACKNVIYAGGENKMLNAVKCSDKLISNLVRRILKSPYASETIIVIASDHLAMKNQVWDTLTANSEKRKNMLLVVDPSIDQPSVKNNNPGSTIDVTPTLLPLMGFDVKLGLGRNLNSEKSIAANDSLHGNGSWRRMVMSFWNFPTVENKVTIMPNNQLSIDGRIFSTPALIVFDDQLHTVMKFSYFSRSYFLTEELAGDKNFLLIDRCNVQEKFTLPIKKSIQVQTTALQYDFSKCLFMGKENVEFARKIRADVSIEISKKSLKTFFSTWGSDAVVDQLAVNEFD